MYIHDTNQISLWQQHPVKHHKRQPAQDYQLSMPKISTTLHVHVYTRKSSKVMTDKGNQSSNKDGLQPITKKPICIYIEPICIVDMFLHAYYLTLDFSQTFWPAKSFVLCLV